MIHLFLATMCKGEAHGDFEQRTMSTDSKAAGLSKNWGMAAGVDVMLNFLSGCGRHIAGSQNGGVFLKQKLDICRH
jgi:hypothetical protein